MSARLLEVKYSYEGEPEPELTKEGEWYGEAGIYHMGGMIFMMRCVWSEKYKHSYEYMRKTAKHLMEKKHGPNWEEKYLALS